MTSRLQSFETEMRAEEENFAGAAQINRELIANVEVDSPQRVVLGRSHLALRSPRMMSYNLDMSLEHVEAYLRTVLVVVVSLFALLGPICVHFARRPKQPQRKD